QPWGLLRGGGPGFGLGLGLGLRAALAPGAALRHRERALDRVLGLRPPLAVDGDAEGLLRGAEGRGRGGAPGRVDVALVVAEGAEGLMALAGLDERDLVADHALDVVGGVLEARRRRLTRAPGRVRGAPVGLVSLEVDHPVGAED